MAKPHDYLPALEAAAELGGRHVLASAWYNDPPFIVDFFAELCDLAAPLALTVDFEFVTWSAVRNLDAAVNVVRAADRPNGGLVIDALHFDRAHTDPTSLAVLPRHWFRFVQLCDGPEVYVPTVAEMIRIGRTARLYLGEGGIDCAAILRELPPVMVSLEIPNAERVANLGAEEHARCALESAKSYCAAHAPDAAA
jgi:sugar phosphate isomerase/epimerase